MILVWNVKGSCSTRFQNIFKNLVETYSPLIMVILEPWASGDRATNIIGTLGFNFNIREEAAGYSRGIWVMWSNPHIISPLSIEVGN